MKTVKAEQREKQQSKKQEMEKDATNEKDKQNRLDFLSESGISSKTKKTNRVKGKCRLIVEITFPFQTTKKLCSSLWIKEH